MRFLSRVTEIPIPEVIAFNDQADDDIGFEWILMELMPGISAWKKWRTLTTFQKVALVQRIAEFQAQILQHTFSGIGTLKTTQNEWFKELPGEMVSPIFFMGEHFDWDIFRGPFRSSHDWLFSYLQVVIKDHQTSIEKADDEDDEDDTEAALFALELAQRLIKLLPRIFPSIQNPPEVSVICHHDLSFSNILVNDKGEITGVIDWESVSTIPLWRSSQLPRFLVGANRETEPNREVYGDASSEGSDTERDPNELDDEGKTDLYWIHLLEYEQTGLRQVYNASMRHLLPWWNAEIEANALKEDFFAAVLRCEQAMYLNAVEQWIDALEKGESPRLRKI